MYNILKLNSIAPLVNDILKSGYTLSSDSKNPEAILVRSAAMHDYVVPETLLAVARAGAGYNNIPFEDYAKRGIVVFNTPGANANGVKELVIASLFLASRKLKPAMAWADGLQGTEGVAAAVEKGKSQFVGPEILGKTIGILGLGAIGKLVAEAAYALGMKVVGYDPFISPATKDALAGKVVIATSLDAVYAASDYLTLHMPLNDETKRMINADAIAKLHDGAVIVNAARGALVDVDAVKAALASGKLSAYVTDFPDETTVGADGIICIPHLGASTPEAEDNCAIMAANQIKDYLENGNILNSVNLPNLTVARTASRRLSVIGTENIVSLISNIPGAKGAKGQVSSKGGYFVHILDFDGEIDIKTIKAIPGVIRARIL
ncbi:MAG: 3-phosphoglycerate dehydrogenase [Clostridiaceae bacterium]|jgi:D-3-phosphoglycerate dehydrogenase|nr:3-phosphoglycerate dehydrogenase [Clostridiaceae bacterium]